MGEGASLYAEVRLGSAAVAVLERAGIRVTLTHGVESGRVQSRHE